MPDNAFIQAVKSVRYAPKVVNWREIGRAGWRGEELTRLRLRNGVVIEALPASRLVGLYKEIWYRDEYRLRREPLPVGATVVDIGANIGVFALYAASFGGAGRVLCFEPFPESFAVLKRNIEHNPSLGVEAYPLGVAGSSGKRRLQVGDCHGWNRMVGEEGGNAVEIECVTLAEAFERGKVQRCDFMKVDCEGAEYEIFLEAPRQVLSRIDRIVLEYHDHLTEHRHGELVDVLRAAGFQAEAQGGPVTGYVYARRGAS